MTMHRNDHIFDPRRIGDDPGNQVMKLIRCGIPHGVRDIDCGRTGLYGFAKHQVKKLRIASAGVLGREFDIVTERAGIRNHFPHLLDHFFRVHLEFVAHVDR